MTNQKTAFCASCGGRMPFSVSSSRETMTVRGVTFSCTELHACCEKCGRQLYVPEISDANTESREEGYWTAVSCGI